MEVLEPDREAVGVRDVLVGVVVQHGHEVDVGGLHEELVQGVIRIGAGGGYQGA